MASFHELFSNHIVVREIVGVQATQNIPKFTACGVDDNGSVTWVGAGNGCTENTYGGVLVEDLVIGGYPKVQLSGTLSMIGSGLTPLTPGDLAVTNNVGQMVFTRPGINFTLPSTPSILLGMCVSPTEIFLFPEPTIFTNSAAGVVVHNCGKKTVSSVLEIEFGGTGAGTIAEVKENLGITAVSDKSIGTGSNQIAAGDHVHEVTALKSTGLANNRLVTTDGTDGVTTKDAGEFILPVVAGATGDMSGFPNRVDTSITFNTGTRQVTLTRNDPNAYVLHLGTKKPLPTSLTLTWADTDGGRYIVLDPVTMTLSEVSGNPDILSGAIFVAYVYWNVYWAVAPVLADERHSFNRDLQWHNAQHLNEGAVWRSGGALTCPLDTSSITLGFTGPIVFDDEELTHTVTHSATPNNWYTQVLNSNAKLPVLYKYGQTFSELPSQSGVQIPAGAGAVYYNKIINVDDGTLDVAPTDTYVNYWIVATNDSRNPIKLLMGQIAHTTAEATASERLSDIGIQLAEIVVLYRLVVHADNITYTTNSYCAVSKVVIGDKVRMGSGLQIGSYSHSELGDRDKVDQHPISSITGLTITLSGKVDVVAGKGLSTNDLTNTRATAVDDFINGDMPDVLILPGTTRPSVPADGFLKMWAQDIGGRLTPKILGPSGLDTPLQPHMGGNGIVLLAPGSGTNFSMFGSGAPTIVGTVSHPLPTNGTNLVAATRRGVVTSAANANSVADSRIATTPVCIGQTYGAATSGGFFILFRFALSSTVAGQRVCVGMSSSTAAYSATLQPSSLTNSVFIGNDSADTNMQIMHNDASGTCTKVNLGSDFPAGASAQNKMYELVLFCKPAGTQIGYMVRNYTDNKATSGVLTTDLPSVTTNLFPRIYANNNGVASAVTMNIFRMYIETDY